MNKHILVTNDDGVNAPGLLALVYEMRRLGKVSIAVSTNALTRATNRIRPLAKVSFG